MKFVHEDPRRRKNAASRRIVSSAAAISGWASSTASHTKKIPGGSVWATTARASGCKSEEGPTIPLTAEPLINAVIYPQTGGQLCEVFVSQPNVYPLLARYKILPQALVYYCDHVIPVTCKVHGISDANGDVSGIAKSISHMLLSRASVDNLPFQSVLALSLLYMDRGISKHLDQEPGIVLLDLRQGIISSIRDRLGSKQYDENTALSISMLIMIDAACGKECSSVPVHAEGLKQVLVAVKEKGQASPEEDAFAWFLEASANKAMLVSELRFEMKSCAILSRVGTSSPRAMNEDSCPHGLAASGLLDLVDADLVAPMVLLLVEAFAAWTWDSTEAFPDAPKVEWISRHDASRGRADAQLIFATRQARLPNNNSAGSWRPESVPGSLTNLEKLILRALFSIGDVRAGIKDWSLWQMDAAQWHALLLSSNVHDARLHKCLVWCMTCILAETADDVITTEERAVLIRTASNIFGSQVATRGAIEACVRIFYWLPRELPRQVSIWAL